MLFTDGAAFIEERTGIPVLGVVPFLRDLDLDQGGSMNCDRRRQVPFGADRVNIVVVLLPKMSNLTDFNHLAEEEDVALRTLPHPAILPEPMSSCLQGPRTQSRIYAILGRRVSQKPFVSMLLGGGRWPEYVAVTK